MLHRAGETRGTPTVPLGLPAPTLPPRWFKGLRPLENPRGWATKNDGRTAKPQKRILKGNAFP